MDAKTVTAEDLIQKMLDISEDPKIGVYHRILALDKAYTMLYVEQVRDSLEDTEPGKKGD